jgi:SPP1 gp7 family putative phage head morphogenesis protein
MLVGLLPASARRKAKRARRAKPVTPNHRAELNYLGDLLVIVEQCRRAGAEVAAGLRVHWDEFVPASDARRAADTATAVPPGLDTLLAQAARRFGGIQLVAHRLAKLATQRTLGAVDDALIESIHRAIGVDISSYLSADTEIGKAMAAAAKANVELIKSIPSQYLDTVRGTVEKAFAAGERWETVAKKIAHVGDVTERRAKFIAQDQISKITSKFNEVRQTSVGISSYIWSTSHDERVRPSHAVLDGQEFPWKNPPVVDGEAANPGEPPRCRCAGIPVIKLDATAESEAA